MEHRLNDLDGEDAEYRQNAKDEWVCDKALEMFNEFLTSIPDWLRDDAPSSEAIMDAACKHAESMYKDYQDSLYEP